MWSQGISVGLEIVSGSLDELRGLADVLLESDARPHLSSESLKSLRECEKGKLEADKLTLSVDSRGITSLVLAIIRWRDQSGKSIIVTTGDKEIVVDDKEGGEKLLTFVREKLEQIDSKRIGIGGPHGPGGGWPG